MRLCAIHGKVIQIKEGVYVTFFEDEQIISHEYIRRDCIPYQCPLRLECMEPSVGMSLNRTESGCISSLVGVYIISVGQEIFEYRWEKSVLQSKKELPNLKIFNLVNFQYFQFSKQWGSMCPFSNTSN